MSKRKPERLIAIADNHGDMIDEITAKALFAFINDYKPSIRLHLGDAFDFRNLRVKASDEEKAMSLEEDWDAGTDFLYRYFIGGKQNVLLYGNHDDRLFQLAKSSNGLHRDYANERIEKLKHLQKLLHYKTLPYDARLGVYQYGKLKAVHGYYCGRNAGARHGATFGNVIFGHTHTVEATPIETVNGIEEARGIGCICKTDMGYDARNPNKLRHRNGWVYGTIKTDGTYDIFQTARVGDDFLCATKFARY